MGELVHKRRTDGGLARTRDMGVGGDTQEAHREVGCTGAGLVHWGLVWFGAPGS